MLTSNYTLFIESIIYYHRIVIPNHEIENLLTSKFMTKHVVKYLTRNSLQL